MYCEKCGNKLELKKDIIDGLVPFCSTCNEYRYPSFSVAISTIILNKERNRILLIKQYNEPYYILVAGYISKGESAEEALKREVKEETNLDVIKYEYNKTKYYKKTNTLMINYISTVDSNIARYNFEVDEGKWFTYDDAYNSIKPNSLAKEFLATYLGKISMK